MSGDGTSELRAKRQKFEAMSSTAAREAKELRNQILLEQATVEVKREMTVGNLVDSAEAANPDIAMQEVHTPEEEDEEYEAPASDPLFRAIESAKDDSRAWMNDGLF